MFRNEKVNALRSQLSWTHYRTLLVLNNLDEIKYYINIAIKENLTYRKLGERIRNKEYKKLSDITKQNNKLIMEYCTDPRIIVRKYVLI